ncbi:ribonuclease H-like domain-containing protein [Tanacetum coccineum]
MESQSETTQTVSALKLLVLKTREYDLWSMRMEQYLTFTDHALWEVIVNGDSVSPIASASAGAEGPIPPKTAEQKLARKNELKAKSTLMLAIPDEHLLKFHACKDAKSLWEAIKNSYLSGGCKSEVVYESEIKGKSSSSSNSQNVAFVSLDNSSSTNETVNTAHSVSAASSKDQASTASYADDVMFSFFANQSNVPQLDYEDLKQIDVDDLEEMDLKWKVAMLTMRVKRFIKKTGRKMDLNDKETFGFDKTKVECYNCHRRCHFARECRAPRNQGNRNRDAPRRNAPVDTSTTNALVVQDGIGYQIRLESLEARIVVHEKNEVVYEEDIAFLNRESDVDDSPVNDRFKIGEGFHAVPPQYTGNYMPSRPDLSLLGLDDSVYKTKNVKSVNKENTHRKEEYPRKSQSPRDNRRNWNGIMTQNLGNGFESIKKACFVCGSLNHLIKDYDFHENKMRVNHQNKLTHPHPKRNFVPTAIATKSGQVPVNAAKQSSPRAIASISTVRPVNTAAPKPKVNNALPTTYSYFKAHSPVRRVFNQKSAAKTNNFKEKVNTARVNNVTTAGPKSVVSAAEGNGENNVKSSACWIWRPTENIIDHNSKDKIDGGFVAFGGSPKGGKITGKGKIRTGKLDFKDVYFVKELKFNLFSVSQMCEKKNSVLFTETECLVLSPDFKLLDESQVLLKVPRHDNMYTFDLKNAIPSGGLTCLFAKAIIDESNLWHRRLGHINFKTMNKLVRENLVRGFPSKLFENDHTCVACQKGKQHKASWNQTNGNAGYCKRALTRISTDIHSVSASLAKFDNADDLPTDPFMPDLEDTIDLLNTGIFSGAYDDDEGAEADLNNLETTMNVSPIPTTRIHKDHPKDQIIGDMNSATQTRRMTKISEEHAMVSYINKQRRTNHKDYQNCLFACFLSQKEPKKAIQALADPSWVEAMQEELLQFRLQKVWTLVDLPNGKRAIGTKWVFRNKKDERGIVVRNKARLVAQDPQFPNKVYKVEKDLYGLHQAPRTLVETLSTYLLENGFRRGTIDKTHFNKRTKVKSCRQVSLMYLTASRPDIMFAVCACARFQVTPKVSHLHAVKRIFRYLKGQPKLGLWYPRDSPFDLEAFSDSDYAGASLDRKSTTGGCQFLGKRLISWQCKKQTIVANSTTEAEYVAAANCCGQVLWIQNQMLDYGFNFMNTKIHIDNESTICIVKNLVFHSKTKHIEIRHHFIRDSYEKRLIQVIKIHTDHNVADLLTKAFDVSRFNFLIASIGLLNL